MKQRQLGLIGLCSLAFLAGCVTTTGVRKHPPVALQQASGNGDENRLMDVTVRLFDPGKPGKKEGVSDEVALSIRKAEARFVPIHLKDTLQSSGHWGAVRVVPGTSPEGDLVVSGEILRSDGEVLALRIKVSDATGKAWLNKDYSGQAVSRDYLHMQRGSHDAFQDVYNQIANDLAKVLAHKSTHELAAIHDVSALRFAADLAPKPYADYLRVDKKKHFQRVRLPAADDPVYQRVQTLKSRDDMLADTLNAHYDEFYDDMWDSYLQWRKSRLEELLAKRKIEQEANTKKALGVGAILGAIALEVFGSRNTRSRTGLLQNVMVAGGAAALYSGINQAGEADIHADAIKELGESLDAEVSPMVVEVDGQTVELKGSADEQYEHWRQLLHRRYAEEVGTAAVQSADKPAEAGVPTEGGG